MKVIFRAGYSIMAIVLFLSCEKTKEEAAPGTYSYDAAFLRKYLKNVIEISDASNSSKVLLTADYQGRVMTSTAGGDNGNSYGWINYQLISSGETKKQFNPVGGEERFWLGPEGGQYSIYFHAGDSFQIKNWQVPAIIDTEPFEIAESSSSSATFTKRTTIINYSGTVFDLKIERIISLLDKKYLESEWGIHIPQNVRFVGYQTDNQITNAGTTDWNKDTGLLSIWLLGMFTPSDQTKVIIPFKPSTSSRSLITTDYFGEIPEERISISDSVLIFACDGKYRSKIGISPRIARSVSGSYDFEKNQLTITRFEVQSEAPYVNSKWEWQEEPYRGDAVNSYNDGPLADGSQLGPFYELESSSPALALKAGERAGYHQATLHLEGEFEALNSISKNILGVDLTLIK